MSQATQWQTADTITDGNFNTMHVFEGDGNPNRAFELNFTGGYLDPSHIKAYMQPYGTADYTYLEVSFVGQNTITLSEAVPEGYLVTVYRDTPKDVPLASFTDGALITAQSLDRNTKQAIFGISEVVDRSNYTQSNVDVALDISNTALTVAEEAKDIAEAAVETVGTVERTIRAPIGDYLDELPVAELRAGRTIAFDDEGQLFVVSPATGTATDVLLELNKSDGASHIGTPTGDVQSDLDEIRQELADGDAALQQEIVDVDVAHRQDLKGVYGSTAIGLATYADIRAYTGSADLIAVKGRAASRDGGFGIFSLDASDTTSVDDGGVVLVDALGRRWKRDYTGPIIASWYGVVPGVDVQAPLSTVLNKGGGQVFIPDGQYTLSSKVTVNHTGASYPVMGRKSSRFDFVGASMTNTVFNTNGNDALEYIGTDGLDGGQGVHSGMRFSDFTVYGTNNTGVGVRLTGAAYLKVRDIDIKRTNIALRLSGILSSDLKRINAQYNNHGMYITSAANSTFNAMRISGMFGANSKWGIEGEVGTNVYIEDSNFEGNGTDGDSTSGGIYLRVVEPLSTINISGYFEANVGRADILIDNRTSSPCVVNLKGCVFNRGGMRGGGNLGMGCTYNIETRSTGGGLVILNLDGCLFFTQTGFGYVPDASKPYIQPAPYLIVNGEDTCHFSETVSRRATGNRSMSLGLSMLATGGASNAPVYITGTKASTGVYTVDSTIPFGRDTSSFQAVATSKTTGRTVGYVQKVSTTSLRIVTLNATTGDVADTDFDLIITGRS